MGNMSYCRFENTALNLQDCLGALQGLIEERRKEDQLSADEVRGAKRMANTCLEIFELLANASDRLFEDLDADALDDTIDQINKAATVEEKEDD